jgi:hypothetical protein
LEAEQLADIIRTYKIICTFKKEGGKKAKMPPAHQVIASFRKTTIMRRAKKAVQRQAEK